RAPGHQIALPLEVAGAGAQKVDDGEEDGEGHEDEAADAELKREGPMVGHGPIQPSPRRRSTRASPQGFALQLERPRLRDQPSSHLATASGRRLARTASSVSA